MSVIRLSQRTLDCLDPPSEEPLFDWVVENVFTKKGDPFNAIDYPWTKGIIEAWDNPSVRQVSFRAPSRVGKTETGLTCLIASQARDPDLGLLGGPDKDKVKEWIKDRLYPMLQKCPPVIPWLPKGPIERWPSEKCKTSHFTIYGGWSGSPSGS